MDKVSAIKEYLMTAAEGKGYQTKLYNLVKMGTVPRCAQGAVQPPFSKAE
jgi:hypothetical protein